ncbi:hypothetical protein [Bacillus sp. FJAT-27445]|uniref:hypothetical protein n=1 Tax=Bacillus sp. FJAT-27445 TaxID=1679166 RepID=UPI0007445026|nr:hypothetical protein [Bacillus sp. FJAT-27445]
MENNVGMKLICTRFVRKADGTILYPKNGDKICFWVTEEQNRKYWEKKAKQKAKPMKTPKKKETDNEPQQE